MYFSQTVSDAGDFNGDQMNDILIGVPGFNGARGGVYVIFGKSGQNSDIDVSSANFNPQQGIKIYDSTAAGIPPDFEYLGTSVSNIGDINGDGIDDIIVGTSLNKGDVYVVYGRLNPSDIDLGSPNFNPTQGFKIYDSTKSDAELGEFASNIGDINGDTINDFMVSDPGHNSDRGIAYVIYGGNPTMPNIDLSSSTSFPSSTGFKIFSSSASSGSRFGRSFSGVDINGDNINDIIIGAPSTTQAKVYVIYGKAGQSQDIDVDSSSFSPNQGFVISDSSNQSRYLGYYVSIAGDMNGDFVDDFIISASGDINQQRGACFVIYGNRNPLSNIDVASGVFDSSQGFKIWDSDSVQTPFFGSSISGGFDINGDMADDVLIGSWEKNMGSGEAYILFGKRGLICTPNCRTCLSSTCMDCEDGFDLVANQCTPSAITNPGNPNPNNPGNPSPNNPNPNPNNPESPNPNNPDPNPIPEEWNYGIFIFLYYF